MKQSISLEIRKTRLDIILKLFYAFIALAGSILVVFNDPQHQKVIDSAMLFLCLETVLIVVLFAMALYIYNEIKCFQDKQNELNKYIEKANYSYRRIIRVFEVAVSVVIIIFLLFLGEKNETFWIHWIEPTNKSFTIAFVGLILCSIVPQNWALKFFSFKKGSTIDETSLIKLGQIPIVKDVYIYGWMINNCGMIFGTKFVFDLLYLYWFK